MSKYLPPLRWYRSLVVQGAGLFFALIGFSRGTDGRWAWTLGGYVVGLVGMTLAFVQDRVMHDGLERCPECNGSGWVSGRERVTDE